MSMDESGETLLQQIHTKIIQFQKAIPEILAHYSGLCILPISWSSFVQLRISKCHHVIWPCGPATDLTRGPRDEVVSRGHS